MTREIDLAFGVKLHLHDYGEALSDHIVREQDFFEREILDYISLYYPIQKCILDVGANIGNHTAYFAATLDYQAIVAFEPIKSNYDLLVQNTKDFGAIYTRNVAIGDKYTKVKMTVNPTNMGACEVNPEGTISVEQIRLDDIIVPPVTLIKIDVEWYEPEVLKGASTLIRDDKPLILLEDAKGHYAQYLPDYYKILKGWPDHKTFLFGPPHHA